MPPSPSETFPTLKFFNGIEVHLLDKETLIALILKQAGERKKTLIANHNLHSIYLFHSIQGFRRIFELADLTHVDGMPLIIWGKVLGYPCRRDQRLTYLDWGPALLQEMEQHGLRLAFLGGSPENLNKTQQKLKASHPDLSLWLHHGYFDTTDEETNRRLLEELNDYQPHILMVGMGMPLQESWISNHYENLPDCVILPCGAFFDYLNGQIPLPNRKAGRMGIEWLVRFIAEPSRLAKRYFWEPWFLLPAMWNDLTNLKQHRRKGKEMISTASEHSTTKPPSPQEP